MALLLWLMPVVRAQDYSVRSFRILPNDVSGFIEPVHDLNGDDCALLKIEAPSDFAFSTPLGIVKRIDSTGEIWLYIPRHSKKLTFKHPKWGVLRDYIFPEKIESHMTYEIKLVAPVGASAAIPHDTVYATLRDTLIVTRVDTLMVGSSRPRIPLSAIVAPTLTFGSSSLTLSGGIMAILMKRHGGFLHLSTDFGRIGAINGECDKEGYIDGRLPFYSGKVRHRCVLFTAGAAHRLSSRIRIFEGVGYGENTTAWQLAESEGGGMVKNRAYSHRGVAFEVGGVYTRKRLCIALSAVTVNGREWYGNIGIGIRIGK